MNSKTIHAKRHKVSAQQGVTAAKVKRKEAAIARLKLQGFNDDEIKIIETGDLSSISKMLLDRELRSLDNIKVYETKDTVHIRKPYGDWKRSEFIYGLEDLQKNIQNGQYTTIEQCMDNGYFESLDIEDQGQLIDIANWYLFAEEMSKIVSPAETAETDQSVKN